MPSRAKAAPEKLSTDELVAFLNASNRFLRAGKDIEDAENLLRLATNRREKARVSFADFLVKAVGRVLPLKGTATHWRPIGSRKQELFPIVPAEGIDLEPEEYLLESVSEDKTTAIVGLPESLRPGMRGYRVGALAVVVESLRPASENEVLATRERLAGSVES